jgi:hypothetical protein
MPTDGCGPVSEDLRGSPVVLALPADSSPAAGGPTGELGIIFRTPAGRTLVVLALSPATLVKSQRHTVAGVVKMMKPSQVWRRSKPVGDRRNEGGY